MSGADACEWLERPALRVESTVNSRRRSAERLVRFLRPLLYLIRLTFSRYDVALPDGSLMTVSASAPAAGHRLQPLRTCHCTCSRTAGANDASRSAERPPATDTA